MKQVSVTRRLNSKGQGNEVYWFILQNPGATNYEIGEGLGWTKEIEEIVKETNQRGDKKPVKDIKSDRNKRQLIKIKTYVNRLEKYGLIKHDSKIHKPQKRGRIVEREKRQNYPDWKFLISYLVSNYSFPFKEGKQIAYDVMMQFKDIFPEIISQKFLLKNERLPIDPSKAGVIKSIDRVFLYFFDFVNNLKQKLLGTIEAPHDYFKINHGVLNIYKLFFEEPDLNKLMDKIRDSKHMKKVSLRMIAFLKRELRGIIPEMDIMILFFSISPYVYFNPAYPISKIDVSKKANKFLLGLNGFNTKKFQNEIIEAYMKKYAKEELQSLIKLPKELTDASSMINRWIKLLKEKRYIEAYKLMERDEEEIKRKKKFSTIEEWVGL